MKRIVLMLACGLIAVSALAVVNGGATNEVVSGAATKLSFGEEVDFCYFYVTGTSTVWFAFGENVTSITNKFPVEADDKVDFTDPSFSFVTYGCVGSQTSAVTYGYYGGK